MSDEESFVILGSCSPGNSLTNGLSICGLRSLEESKIESSKGSVQTAKLNGTSGVVEECVCIENTTPTNSINGKKESEPSGVSEKPVPVQRNVLDGGIQDEDNPAESDLTENTEMNKNEKKLSMSQMTHSDTSGNSGSGSLAASFIMGEINAEVLKSSIYSQFPSLCSMEACAEDVVKLQNFMSEYLELKSTLTKVNGTVRQFYNKTQKWHEDMQRTEQQYKQQLQECQSQIAKLSNEKLELKQYMESQIEQMKITDMTQREEVKELVESLSEKAALIDNMRGQISRLEQQQLTSFEYIPKNANDSKENPDYIARTEHLHELKVLERKMSGLLAENLELKDMKHIYLDEINCLKVNLTAAEELLQQSREDIQILKSNDQDKSARFIAYEKERDKMREEIEILRQQVDVYSKDFQMERTARENLAGEKEKLIQDLRTMQRNNQQLVEELHRRLETVVRNESTTASAATSAVGSVGQDNNISQVSPRFIAKPLTAATFATNIHQRPIRPLPQSNNVNSHECPLCSKRFNSLTKLQSHVNSCLDNAEVGR